MNHSNWIVLALLLLASNAPAQQLPPNQFLTGIDANYALDLESRGHRWFWSMDGKQKDVFELLAAKGCNAFRVRLWTGDEGMNGLHYATESARRAKRAGLQPYLVIFLSENWADMVKQPTPAIWKDLGVGEKRQAIESYCEKVVKHFKDAGLDIDLYEIGNEIDFGICGVFEEEWPKRVSLDYMKKEIWPQMAPIIESAQRGVRRVNPKAKFTLHLAQWNNFDYCLSFWQFMVEHNVVVDFAGLSYFPSSIDKLDQSAPIYIQNQAKKIHEKLHRQAIICEYAFPCMPKFDGQFADWNKPVPGHTFDEPGQQKWLAEFVTHSRINPALAGVFYWSPEWNPSPMWSAFALFSEKGMPRPAIESFKK